MCACLRVRACVHVCVCVSLFHLTARVEEGGVGAGNRGGRTAELVVKFLVALSNVKIRAIFVTENGQDMTFMKERNLLLFSSREGEKHQCVVASHMPRTGDLVCHPGMCPDWESNPQPFRSQAGAQSTELCQPG